MYVSFADYHHTWCLHVAYLSLFKLRRLLVRHVEGELPDLVDLFHTRIYGLELRLKHGDHRLRNEGVDGHRFEVRFFSRQRIFRTQFNAAIFDSQKSTTDAVLGGVRLAREVHVAKVEARGRVFESDLDKRRLDDTIDVPVRGRLAVDDAIDVAIQMAGLHKAQ
jgi:hypothetical protein